MLDVLLHTNEGFITLLAFTAVVASGVVALVLGWRRLRDTSPD